MAATKFLSTIMYSQLQPWSTVGAFPCLEQVAGPPIPHRVGVSYRTTKPHPWRPTLGYELVNAAPLHEQPIINQFLNPCFAPSKMSTEPLLFPNLVTGFERNPQHAARAALYTRYTNDDWLNNLKSKFAASDSNRKYSESLRNDIVRLLRETDEKATRGQCESGRYIGERITEVSFWRDELNDALEKLVSETSSLMNLKRDIAKAMQDLEAILHIAQECIYHREGRQGIEKAHDIVEKALLIEIDNIRNNQKKLNGLSDLVDRQMLDSRAAQHALEEDVVHKEATLGIDKIAHQLNNYSRGINYYGGIEKYDPHISDAKTWTESSEHKIRNAMSIREKSKQLRIDIDRRINNVAISIWDHWSYTNNTLDKRTNEMLEAKNNIQYHLLKVQEEIFNIEKIIDLIKKAIQDKTNPLKVTHTRLEARIHREGLELCKDHAYSCLLQEVSDIQESIRDLHNKLEEAEAQHQQLLKFKSHLEVDLKNKVNALFIDREKCMSLRRSFPINNLIKY